MKKHYIILGIVLLAGLFFIPTLLKRCEGPVVPVEELTEEPSTLNSRIESIGENRFAKSEYIALRNEITGYASARKISAMERDNYRSTLNRMLQKALALSYKYNFEHDCYATNMAELNSAGDTIKTPINTLKTQQIIYKRFQSALNFRQRLLVFCSGQYSAEGANKLKGDYSNIISGQPFIRCSRIQQLKKEINQECDVFGIFHGNYNEIVVVRKEYYYYKLDGPQLTKYRWYRAKIIEKQNEKL
jgi:hypothetical protein